MKEITIKRNTPTMPEKVSFFKALVAFYEATVANPNVSLTDEQQRCVDAVAEFEGGNTHIRFPYSIHNLDLKVVRTLTPMHRRKANLYRILTAFFDTSLSNVVTKAGTAEEDTDGYKDTAIAVSDCIAALPVGVVFLAPSNVSTHQAEKAEESRKPKRGCYTVRVTKTLTYYARVVAESQEDAEDIALGRAEETPLDEWDENNTDTYTINECEL